MSDDLTDRITGAVTGYERMQRRNRVALAILTPDHPVVRLLAEARDEIDRLQAWKDSAMDVLSRWDDVWDALGRPGELGSDKSVSALAEALRLVEGAE